MLPRPHPPIESWLHMWIKFNDTLVFESAHTPKALSWSATKRSSDNLSRIITISVLVGVLAGIGVLISGGNAHVVTGLLFIAGLVVMFAFMRWENKERDLRGLTKSILKGLQRKYYAVPGDFSYQVIPEDLRGQDDARLQGYFMSPLVQQLDVRIKEKPKRLSAVAVRNHRNEKFNVISMAEDLLTPDQVVALRAEAELELREGLHIVDIQLQSAQQELEHVNDAESKAAEQGG